MAITRRELLGQLEGLMEQALEHPVPEVRQTAERLDRMLRSRR